jgi:hypothetical protein
MQPLPHLATCLRLAFDARDPAHPSGISLASYFARAAVRGRKRSDLQPDLLFPGQVRARLGPSAAKAIALAMDAGSFRSCPAARPTVPLATREWLAEAALSLGRAEGFPLMWALLRAMSELEAVAQRLLGARTPRSVVRQILHGVGARTLRVEPFAALLVRVLKIAQAVYAAFRHAGFDHAEAWAAAEDRLWAPHPTGRGSSATGAYLPSLVQAASGNARRRLRRNQETGRTQEHAQALLARFSSGPGPRLWPWSDGEGRLLPHREALLSPEVAGLCFFVLLTHMAGERRSRGGPAGGLSQPFAEAGFGAPEWLPDRTDDLAVRLLAAGAADGVPRGELLDAISSLLRSTLARADEPMLLRARDRLPELLRWLEENGRELLETG